MKAELAEGRVALRQRRIRKALVAAGCEIITQKGIDAATMQEIADRADIGAGTIYSYFKSKDELAISVMESVMHGLAVRIEKVTDTFEDPAQVYAYGVRMVIDAATGDARWKQLLHRSEVISDALYRCMGPFAVRDLKKATAAGRCHVVDAELTWRMAAYAIIGVSLAITTHGMPVSVVPETIVRLLCMAGVSGEAAVELVGRHHPPLPEE